MSIRQINMNIWIEFRCPKCEHKNSVGLVKFSDAIDQQFPLGCVACGVDMYVEMTCQTRAAELRNEAVDAGQTCPSCGGSGVRYVEPAEFPCDACEGQGHV
ncbi:MAG: hypothetical protein HY865_00960 [Chloroflexi bacterium]|nr:hypothetical protein [Chloroflexota bacterium]